MNIKKYLVVSAFATAFYGGGAGIVLAESGASELEEITVTARRREENMQEVPVAISAFSAEDLEMRNIESTENLQLSLPNVDIRGGGRQGGGQGFFTVRGVQGVARYVDGVALTGNSAGLATVMELERIEVLRGPQGTYFGKNAIGGAIQYVSKKPADEFGARVKATVGSYDRRDIQANIDIPLSENVRSKITAAKLYKGGYVDSLTIDEEYGEKDETLLIGQLEWDITDNFNAYFNVSKVEENSNMQAYVLFDVVEGIPGPDTPAKYNDPAISNFPFTDELYALGGQERYENLANFTGDGVMTDSTSASMTLNWEINDSLSLKSITGMRDLDNGIWVDSDASPLGYFNTWGYTETEEISQELQFSGGNDRLDWIVGAYYQNTELTTVATNWQRLELTGMGAGAPRIRNTIAFRDITDEAIFGELTYNVTDQLSVTAGVRKSKEEGEVSTIVPAIAQTAATFQTPHFNTQGDVRLVAGVPQIIPYDDSATTPRLAVQYQFTDDVMVYASYSEGFNGGGVNSTFNPTQPNNGIIAYTSEILENTEIGIRADLFNNMLRLNATAFSGDYNDVQIGETLTPGVMSVTNGGAAEISGFELEGFWRATDDITVDFTVGLLDTEYTDVGQATTIGLGTPFPFAPDESYSIGVQWDKEITSGTVSSRLDYGHISKFETFTDELFQTAIGQNNPYGLLSGRITYRPANEKYTVALFGTNLTDEWYRLGGFSAVLAGIDQGVVARPREFGLSLDWNF